MMTAAQRIYGRSSLVCFSSVRSSLLLAWLFCKAEKVYLLFR